MGMTTVTPQENSMIQGISLSDPLADRVNRVPLHPIPFDPVGSKYSLGRCLDLLWCSLLSRVPIRVGGGCDLDVETNQVVLSGNDHD